MNKLKYKFFDPKEVKKYKPTKKEIEEAKKDQKELYANKDFQKVMIEFFGN